MTERIVDGKIYVATPDVAVQLHDATGPGLRPRIFTAPGGLREDTVYIFDLDLICTGRSDCHAGRHIHGCDGDEDGNCDRPEEHIPWT